MAEQMIDQENRDQDYGGLGLIVLMAWVTLIALVGIGIAYQGDLFFYVGDLRTYWPYGK